MEIVQLSGTLAVPEHSTLRVCDNCETPATGKFCVNCGQEHEPGKLHFKDFVVDYIRSLIDIDSKSLKSMRWLVFKPGLLDAQYIQGKRASYVSPSQIYLCMSIIFFFVASQFDPLTLENSADLINPADLTAIYATQKMTPTEVNTLFQEKVHDHLPAFLMVVVPILALFLGVLYQSGKKYYFVHHLTFSYHFFAFLFLILIPGNFNEDLASIGLLSLFIYLWIALKKTYEEGLLTSGLKAGITWLIVILLLYAYLDFSVNYTIGEIKAEVGL
jgi:hypothetical protein